MNNTKGVIRIIKLASNPNEYDEYYYFTGINVDNYNHINANVTGDIWGAMKFTWNSSWNEEIKRVESLIEFVKTCFIPKKQYKIEFIPITLDY